MVFSSLLFLFRFLPAVLILYFIAPRKARNFVLLAVSLIFYAWGEPVYVVLMIASILITWTGGLAVDALIKKGKRRGAKAAAAAAVSCGLGLLIVFKYTDFILSNINQVGGLNLSLPGLALPIGISFYTFQTISYIIDVYRGDAEVQKNIISYGAYVTMFPQLIAGPIVQYRTIDRQLRTRQESAEEFAQGAGRFLIGLGKKVLLANNAGALWDSIRVLNASQIPVVNAWIGIAAFTFQIYFDFSAYSDMAIGLGHMFGFRFLENFDYPYESKSVTEFWRRWHISLGTWFREYVYIPLGGNRRGTLFLIRNTMIVWLLTGIWHGAAWNFLIWGLYYGVLLLVEKLFLQKFLDRMPRVVQHIYCMFIVMIGWLIFSWGDISGSGNYFLALFGAAGNPAADTGSVYLLYTNALLLVFLIVGSTTLPKRAAQALLEKTGGRDLPVILLRGVTYTVIFILSVAYLVDASYNPFLYFRF